MIIIDIVNNIDDITSSKYLEIIFHSNNKLLDFEDNPFNEFSQINSTNKIIIKIKDFLGKGSFGHVYKFKYKDSYYAIKLNSNEIPIKLYQRYNSLYKNKKIRKYLIKIFCCGKIKSDNFKYYSIMEYGGMTLNLSTRIYDRPILYNIVYQLVYIVYTVVKYKILLTDFKLSNLTLDSNHNIKIIDLYIYCDDYDTCENCKIIKTYAPIEIQKFASLFKNDNNFNYNYTYICLPFVLSMINLLCKYDFILYAEKLAKKYSIKDIKLKDIINLLQISSYFYNIKIDKKTENKNNLLSDKNIYYYIKMTCDKYPFIKNDAFYEYFLNNIEIKEEYTEFISKNTLLLLINDFINMDPNKRYFDMIFELVKNIRIKN